MSESWLPLVMHVTCSNVQHRQAGSGVIEQPTRTHFHFAAGFMQQFAAVSSMAKPEDNLAEVINQLSGGQDPNRVLCCGHSLGGALATLGEPCHAVPRESPI